MALALHTIDPAKLRVMRAVVGAGPHVPITTKIRVTAFDRAAPGPSSGHASRPSQSGVGSGMDSPLPGGAEASPAAAKPPPLSSAVDVMGIVPVEVPEETASSNTVMAGARTVAKLFRRHGGTAAEGEGDGKAAWWDECVSTFYRKRPGA
jgi:hypothetical protein